MPSSFENKHAIQSSSAKDICINTVSASDIERVLDAHIKIQKMLGRGRKGCVYELLQTRNRETQRFNSVYYIVYRIFYSN